jgi:hypothetical protein
MALVTAARERVVLLAAGVLAAAAGVWFAVSWVDTGYDSTCSAVVYRDVWISGRLAGRCRGVMLLRSGVVAFLLVGGLVLTWLGVRDRALTAGAVIKVGIVSLMTVALILVINEVVRSGGALS